MSDRFAPTAPRPNQVPHIIVPRSAPHTLLRRTLSSKPDLIVDPLYSSWRFPVRSGHYLASMVSDRVFPKSWSGRISRTDIRARLRELYQVGDTAAFLVWLSANGFPLGRYATVPSTDGECLGHAKRLWVACFDRAETHCELSLRLLNEDWDNSWQLVAFERKSE